MTKNEIVRYLSLIGGGILLIGMLVFGTSIVENVDSGEIVVFQGLISGEERVVRTPGVVGQWFARTTSYDQSYQFEFSDIRTTFNDKGGASLGGTLRWDMPLEDEKVLELHRKFGSKGGEEAIERELIRPAVSRAVFNTGPLMSSTESAAERRPDILFYAVNQIRYGVYRTNTREEKATDPITGAEKTVAVVELMESTREQDFGYARQESSPVEEFRVEISDFTVNEINYDPEVKEQIETQRQITTEVQTAVANAIKAEQDAITAEQEGKASAAKARAAEEVKKAQAVTSAESAYEVAVLERKTAEENKAKKILDGEGEARAKELIFNADGALSIKLDAMVQMNEAWAKAYAESKHPNVPGVFFGGGSTPNGSNAVQDLATLKMLEMAKQLNVDLRTNN